jgi:excisionase family DNA binding protein
VTARKPVQSVADPAPKKRYNETPVDAKVIAKMLGCTDKHVYAMAKRGEIPSLRYGRKVLFFVSEIEEWKQAHSVYRAV